MGLFSRKVTEPVSDAGLLPNNFSSLCQSQQQQQHTRQKHSFTDPPNTYCAAPSQAQRPPRPSASPYGHGSYNKSQPHFYSTGYQTPQPQWLPPLPQKQNMAMAQSTGYSGCYQQQQFGMAMISKPTIFMVDPPPDAIAPMPSKSQLSSRYNDMSKRFSDIMTMIDCESLRGDEEDLFACGSSEQDHHKQKKKRRQRKNRSDGDKDDDFEGGGSEGVEQRREVRFSEDETQERALFKPSRKEKSSGRKTGEGKKVSGKHDKDKIQPTRVAASVVSGTYFSKVDQYANSRLPDNLPPLALYMATWPLLCLAAQYSQSVYDRPSGREREAHVPSDWRTGTKAMRIKSVPMDHMNTIVFAIRGTSTFMDWAVNLHSSPLAPEGFLDDPGNLCHAGFLNTARKMIKPVARRLQQLLAERPGREKYSLLITGHSAGGAVAALLYCHMMSTAPEARTELRTLTGRFKRVHCVTFGAPPISLLPLAKPQRPELKRSIFMSFVNEGDPVVRAEKPYVKSLLELLASPPPANADHAQQQSPSNSNGNGGHHNTKKDRKGRSKSHDDIRSHSQRQQQQLLQQKPTWHVPPATLSNAGRIVVLRSGTPRARPKDRKTVRERLEEGVVAVTCQEEQLRQVIFGDPVAHMMSLYAGRIETLAVGAVTVKSH